MKRKLILLLVVSISGLSFIKDKPAYRIYDAGGKKSNYQKMVKELRDADIIFFGELHDNPIAHWLQFELTSDMYNLKKKDLILAAEMFEADNQIMLDEFLGGDISEKNFEDEARLWQNYKTDYKPLLAFAKDNGILFIASNIPRRYASIVFRNGFEGLDSLSDQAKKYIHPLPIPYDPEVKCYKDMLNMQGMGMNKSNENFPKAQAVKDATMAHFILQNWKKGKLLIHFNGSYHSDNFEGIVWYLNRHLPELKITTITTQLQEDIDTLVAESYNTANYILVVPETMTRTY